MVKQLAIAVVDAASIGLFLLALYVGAALISGAA
jgi:hypothetical protein